MPYRDPEQRRAASRASQRRRRSGAANGANGSAGVDTARKTSTPLSPAGVLERLARELDQLDAAKPPLDPAVRARTVARVCAVALAAHKALEAPADPPVWWDLARLTSSQAASLQRLLAKMEAPDG